MGLSSASSSRAPGDCRRSCASASACGFDPGGGHDAVAALQAGGEPEGAAHPGRAVDADVAAHQLRQAAGDRQPEAGAAVLARGRGVGLLEGLEQPLPGSPARCRCRCPRPRSAPAVRRRRLPAAGPRSVTRPVVGELDGVAGEVEQGLAQPRRVAAQPGRHRVAVDLDRQALGPRRSGDDGRDVVEDGREVEVGVLQSQLAGLDLGQVEDVVDDRQQVLARGVDLGQALGLLRRGAGALQQVGQADDGVHRRADLVAHVGQEGALGPVGGLGGVLGML